jgi:arabinoxylan arabinofuranohydrolase
MSRNQKLISIAVVLAALAALLHPRQSVADYPIFFQRYTADPGTLEWNGRLYLYGSHDLDTQTQYEMFDITCISTDDLKNWTDHGECFNARTGSSWAQFSWAPSVVARNNRFYMYYGNSGGSIGVAVADSPTGPFIDTRGRALIDAGTPGVNPPQGMWIFDPAAFIDDDGRAWLYFGGNGPSNIRIIQLGNDMVSTVGSAISLSAPRFFEAAWMHKNNGRYYFSYSTNWDNGAPTIDYMTSNSPTSGFTYVGTVLPQPPENNNNNHAGIFKYQNNWYIAYHNRTLARLNGTDPGFRRNLALDQLSYSADGRMIAAITTNGVPQLKNLNPYNLVEAETMNRGQGIETEASSEGGRNVSHIENGDWVRVTGVDFGTGASRFEARVASATSGGSIQLRLGSSTGTLVGTCTVPGTGGWQSWSTVSCNVGGATGVRDLYLVFTGGSGNLFNINWWRFSRSAGTTFPLTITKAGTGSGTVTSNTGDINCGSTCSANIASGTSVTLTATAAGGSSFAGWSGACTGTGTCTASMSAARSVTATFQTSGQSPVFINAGGSAAGSFVADTNFSGGSTFSTTNTIDTSRITGTVPPQAVFQTERYGEFTYTIPNRTPGTAQTVTLYFQESFWTAAGQRTFNVIINGTTVLTAFDIFAAAGGANRAIARTFTTTANSNGQVAIQFTRGGGPDNPKVCGISVSN